MSHNLFNKLADETILEILDHLDDGLCVSPVRIPPSPLNPDLWAITRADKRLHQITLPLLYRRITIAKAEQVNGILRLLAESPHYAGLVKSLWLAQPCHTSSDTRNDEDLATNPDTLTIEYEGSIAMADTTQVQDAANDRLPRELLLSLQQGHSWAKCLLLVHLLPGLEELYSSTFTLDYEDLLAQMMMGQGWISPKLRIVKMSSLWETIAAFVLVPAFLCPSVVEVHGHGVVAIEGELYCDWFLFRDSAISSLYGRSNVERIELHHSRLDKYTIMDLLRLPKALKTFIYSEAEASYATMKIDFKEALEVTSGILENLSVRWKGTGSFIENDRTWTFHYFTSLKNMFISYRLIFGPQPADAVITSNVFPPTLEVLGMYPSQPDEDEDEESEDEWEDASYIKCFEVLLHQKDATNLPNLRLVAHLDDLPLLENLIELAESRGVQIALQKSDLEFLPF
jgi:hypothetical protein